MWIITLKASELDGSGNKYRVVIQLPDLKEYTNFQVMVKDFMVIRTATLPTNEMTYSLASSLYIDNNYDTKLSSTTFNVNRSNILTTVHSNAPYFNCCGEFVNVSKVNGIYEFWLIDDENSELVEGTDFKDFIITLVFKGVFIGNKM